MMPLRCHELAAARHSRRVQIALTRTAVHMSEAEPLNASGNIEPVKSAKHAPRNTLLSPAAYSFTGPLRSKCTPLFSKIRLSRKS
jgi:hypothetical protein